VRWEALFDDLEAELDAAEAAELELEVRDRTRREVSRLRLFDRLQPALDQDLTVHVSGAGVLRGRLERAGPDWLLLASADAPAELVVPYAAVLGVTGLSAHSSDPDAQSPVTARLRLGHALRGLAQRRLGVAVTFVDGTAATGTLDRVGADFAELAEHPPGEPRRSGLVRAVRAVPFSALAVVRGT
jgi:hypothetical protein